MPKLSFQTDRLTVDVPDGAEVMSLVDELGASVSFGCRSGMCGTCVVTVVEGQASLSRPSSDELKTLEETCAKPGQRLACQLKVFGDVQIA